MSISTTQKPTTRRIVGMMVGIVIIGLGIALFKQSHLGNDSISALNMRLAELLGISLGVQNVATNILFFALEFWFGRKYIGLGTFVNGIGMDTITLRGSGFTLLVQEGQTVRAGTPLLRVDLDVIRAAGLSTESAVIVTNADDLPALHLTAGGIVSTGTPLFKFE